MEDTNVSADTSLETSTPAPEESTVETQDSSPDAGQPNDSFFDPKQLSPELMPAYKQMQAAFTKKTQEIANFRKEYDALRQKAESFSKYEQYVPVIEEMLTKPQVQSNPRLTALEQQLKAQGYSDEYIEGLRIYGQGLYEIINAQKQEEQQAQQAQKQQEYLQSRIAEAEKLDPRLSDNQLVYQTDDGEQFTFGDLVAQFVTADPMFRQDPLVATQKAIKRVDALIGRAKTQGKEELSQAARDKGGRFAPTKSSPQGAIDTSKPRSIREAAELARKQLGV